jgi:uncharacterized protein YdeI (YjbR/CyaY-like superfamily)
MNSKVNWFFNKAGKWQEEVNKLRTIPLDCGLAEELKWGNPCYTFRGNNIVLIHVFKEYCAFLFFKGALLNDTQGILVQQTENVQGPRQVRFTNMLQIAELLKTAFEALTPGRKKGYLLHFAAPKQSKTRVARVEKYMPQIMNGKGLDD